MGGIRRELMRRRARPDRRRGGGSRPAGAVTLRRARRCRAALLGAGRRRSGHRLRDGGLPEPSATGTARRGDRRRRHRRAVGRLAAAAARHRRRHPARTRSARSAATPRSGAQRRLRLSLGRALRAAADRARRVHARRLFEELGIITGRTAAGDADLRRVVPLRRPAGAAVHPRPLAGRPAAAARRLRRGPRANTPPSSPPWTGSATARGSDGRRAFAIPVDRSSRRPGVPRARPTHHGGLDARRRAGTAAPLRWYVDYCCRDDFGAACRATSPPGPASITSPPATRDGPRRSVVLTWPEGNGYLGRATRPPGRAVHDGGARLARAAGRRRASAVDVYEPGARRLAPHRGRAPSSSPRRASSPTGCSAGPATRRSATRPGWSPTSRSTACPAGRGVAARLGQRGLWQPLARLRRRHPPEPRARAARDRADLLLAALRRAARRRPPHRVRHARSPRWQELVLGELLRVHPELEGAVPQRRRVASGATA